MTATSPPKNFSAGQSFPPRRGAASPAFATRSLRARGKDLAYKVSHPEGDGPCPLIVFSHGFGGSKDAFSTIARHWAGHEYVVIQPTHADGLRRRDGDRDVTGGRPGPRDHIRNSSRDAQ